ncbi:MAG: ATP-dependent sacrificial sulfur transferase LarE [Calditrichae bacterium]|nr:ATP-dependent sacrificial sulfur transferase LarE [Calditrichia bacterium]
MLNTHLEAKYDNLIRLLKKMHRVLIAYSGGIDSTLLLKVGTDQLGKKCIGVIAVSGSLAKNEYVEALEIAGMINANIIEVKTDELNNALYQQNDHKRCFYCKTELFQKLQEIALENGIKYVLDGNNVDDTYDYRPGRQAAKNLAVRSPLIEADFTKEDIRILAKYLKLPNWDKPAQPCLASRIAYGVSVREEVLNQIDQAESILKKQGFKIVRVRYLGEKVSIEVGKDELERFANDDLEKRIYTEFNKIGFNNVEIDRDGYSSGKLNVINNHPL